MKNGIEKKKNQLTKKQKKKHHQIRKLAKLHDLDHANEIV
jgi:hypothetical protein